MDGSHHVASLQVVNGLGGRGKVQAGQLGDQAAIGLFGERIVEIIGAQSGFHMPNRDPVVKSCQGSSEGGGGISLHQNQLRMLLLKVEF